MRHWHHARCASLTLAAMALMVLPASAQHGGESKGGAGKAVCGSIDESAGSKAKWPGLVVEAEVQGGLDGFPMGNEQENHCVPTSIARAIVFLTRGPSTDRRVEEVDKAEPGLVSALRGQKGWRDGYAFGTMDTYRKAKEQYLIARGLFDEIETIPYDNPKPTKEFFQMLAEELKNGAAIEVAYTGYNAKGEQRTHMSNVGRIVSHNGNWGYQPMDDPSQGDGKPGLGWRAARLWNPDGSNYALKENGSTGRALKTLHGFIVEKKKKKKASGSVAPK